MLNDYQPLLHIYGSIYYILNLGPGKGLDLYFNMQRPRTERTCLWCSNRLNTHTTDSENHSVCTAIVAYKRHQEIKEVIKKYPSKFTCIDRILQLTDPDGGLRKIKAYRERKSMSLRANNSQIHALNTRMHIGQQKSGLKKHNYLDTCGVLVRPD